MSGYKIVDVSEVGVPLGPWLEEVEVEDVVELEGWELVLGATLQRLLVDVPDDRE